MDNESLERSIRSIVQDAVMHIAKDVARLEAIVEVHRNDAYAHRQMVEAYKPEQQEWQRWRSGVDVRLAAIAGGLTVFAFIVSVFGAFVGARIFH